MTRGVEDDGLPSISLGGAEEDFEAIDNVGVADLERVREEEIGCGEEKKREQHTKVL